MKVQSYFADLVIAPVVPPIVYEVICQTCGMGARTNHLTAAERLAWDHVQVKPGHILHVSGGDAVTQILGVRND